MVGRGCTKGTRTRRVFSRNPKLSTVSPHVCGNYYLDDDLRSSFFNHDHFTQKIMRLMNRGLQHHQSITGSIHPSDLDETRQSMIRAERRRLMRQQMADTPTSDI